MYTVITCQKVVGWSERQDFCFQSVPTTDINEAKHRYWEYGGKLTTQEEI
jgi:hypothetical protein